jgi:hypothetical protein
MCVQGGYVHSPKDRAAAAMAQLPDGSAVLFGGAALTVEDPGVRISNDLHMIRLHPSGTTAASPSVSQPGRDYTNASCNAAITLTFSIPQGGKVDYYLDSPDGWRWQQDLGYTRNYTGKAPLYARTTNLVVTEYVVNTTATDLKLFDHAGRAIPFTGVTKDWGDYTLYTFK